MRNRLLPRAWVVLALQAMYGFATALSTVFVSVYLWVNSHDFTIICRHYLLLFATIPLIFILSGWYSQVRDRVHVYRAGLVLHALFYAMLLMLREQSPHYAGWLGAFLGVTWGVFFAGANTFNFDVTASGQREYFLGLIQVINSLASLFAPILSGAIISFADTSEQGYHRVFALVVLLFVGCLILSGWVPKDGKRRAFKIKRALFPGRDQRDWRLMMLASASLTGSYSIFPFLLGVLMYMQTGNELAVGGYGTFQALAALAAAYVVGHTITNSNRRRYLWWGVVTLLLAGCLMWFRLNLVTLFLFGFFRSVSQPMFGIPHSALNLDVIQKSAEDPAQRIEYLCAWEVPLAVGRVLMISLLWIVYVQLGGGDIAARTMLFILCSIRILSYQCIVRTSYFQETTQPARAQAEA